MANLIIPKPKIHLVIPDPHAHPDFNNERATLAGKLIKDLKPDVVVNLGDMWDMSSMSSYDRGRKSTFGRTFQRDIDAGLDFDERLWDPVRKAKKKKPRAIFIEGNHEFRLKRAIDLQPELEGLLSFNNFDLNKNYNDIVEYQGNTPGMIEIDGVTYCHYSISGVMGRPIGGEHPAYSLLTKQFTSVTCGHLHTLDFSTRVMPNGHRINGLVAGCFQDYNSGWAGEINRLWSRGLVIKREVEGGNYNFQWVTINELKKEYGNDE